MVNKMYKTMKNGDVFYECEYGRNYEFIVVTEPKCDNNKWTWTAKNTKTDQIVEYLITEGYEHYGPRIYSQPQYVKMVNGEMVFLINE